MPGARTNGRIVVANEPGGSWAIIAANEEDEGREFGPLRQVGGAPREARLSGDHGGGSDGRRPGVHRERRPRRSRCESGHAAGRRNAAGECG